MVLMIIKLVFNRWSKMPKRHNKFNNSMEFVENLYYYYIKGLFQIFESNHDSNDPLVGGRKQQRDSLHLPNY